MKEGEKGTEEKSYVCTWLPEKGGEKKKETYLFLFLSIVWKEKERGKRGGKGYERFFGYGYDEIAEREGEGERKGLLLPDRTAAGTRERRQERKDGS